MVRFLRYLTMALAAGLLAISPAGAAAQGGSVQVTAADAKVFLSADATSPVVSAVPVGAVLEVVSKTDAWYQVRLPKDGSGFDRVGYLQKAKVKEMAAPAGGAARPAAAESAASAPRAARPTAAVLDFEFGAIQNWWGGNWDIGKGISDMLVDELLQTGQLRLLERKQIQSVLGEQNLANSDRADQSAKEAARIGKVLGATLLVTGSITKFGSEEKNVGGAAGGFVGGMLGGAGAKNTTAVVALTVRVIDASTSEILASVKSEGKSNRRGLLLGGAGGGKFASMSMGSKDFQETILGEATEKSVKDAAAKLQVQLANALR